MSKYLENDVRSSYQPMYCIKNIMLFVELCGDALFSDNSVRHVLFLE